MSASKSKNNPDQKSQNRHALSGQQLCQALTIAGWCCIRALLYDFSPWKCSISTFEFESFDAYPMVNELDYIQIMISYRELALQYMWSTGMTWNHKRRIETIVQHYCNTA